MQSQENIIDCYNKTAKNYAEKFFDELANKHLDNILLKAFAENHAGNGPVIDLGCGPGQTTKFLYDCGVTNIVGTDLSQSMIDVARSINPQLKFETADMLALQYADASFGAAIAFYSIVHFSYEEIQQAFLQIRRILRNGGHFLFSFHIGDQTIHFDEFLDAAVNIDFYFFDTSKVRGLLTDAGFEIVDVLERQPYLGFEHPSTRAYIWAKAV